MIYFIGDKPSKKNIDKNVAFVGTRSYKTLLDWIYRMNLNINKICLFNHKGFINTRLKHINEHDAIVALGNVASEALSKENVPHIKIPHPSGLNRVLNDKKMVDKFLKHCKDYIGECNASWKDKRG